VLSHPQLDYNKNALVIFKLCNALECINQAAFSLQHRSVVVKMGSNYEMKQMQDILRVWIMCTQLCLVTDFAPKDTWRSPVPRRPVPL
jgi:hypothetical protein